MEATLLWGIVLTVAVVGVCGLWFLACGRANRTRQVRALARRTLLYGSVGFLGGIALLTSDLGRLELEGRMLVIAVTACCGLLVCAATVAVMAADDQSLIVVNLTGRALLLADPELAPFFTLPAPQQDPATELPPVLPRTCYVVAPDLGRLGAEAGRTDVYTVDADTATDYGINGVLVRRLIRAVPPAA